MKKFIILSAVALGLSLSSCDDYLDINEDPNSPAESNLTPGMLMPSIEMQLAATYGGDLRSVGGYHVQHYSQQFGTQNYLDYAQFTMSSTRCSQFYTLLNQRCLTNIQTLLAKAEASEDWGTYLAGTTLRAFIYQVMVDCWGEIPYTEALNPSITSPKYDDGSVIYEGILAELDNALAKASTTSTVCTNLLYPGEKADAWIKFANALKLRILMRESKVKDVKSQIASLIAEGNFPAEDVKFAKCWTTESGSLNPFYDNDFYPGRQENIVANIAIIGTMLQKNADGDVLYEDGRLASYFSANGNGKYTGSISGSNFSTSGSYKASYWCRPKASATSPVVMLSVAEIEFLIAEYNARYGTADAAKAHYVAAVEASFDAAGAEGAEAFLAKFPYNNNEYAKCIGIAKWMDLAGYNSYEAWCEARRLGFPEFNTEVKGIDMYNLLDDASYKPEKYVPGTLYTPIQVYGQLGNNKLLARYPYPESSTSRNNNSPEFPGFTAPVFWAKAK